ncbi:MAG: hypothetical protein FJW36_06240 [Acidobacteria bacterium]|nr:hypothetical protein [Acidobacteriota bacterium]
MQVAKERLFANSQLSQRFCGETHLLVKSKYILNTIAKAPFYCGLAVLALVAQMQAQVLDNNFLNGRYGFRQLLIATNSAGQPIEARSFVGVISFDGRGSFSFQGTRNSGNNPPAPFSGAGSYSVAASGLCTMTSPLDLNANLNARLATGLLLGSTTDSAGNSFDIFAAVPLPQQTVSNAAVTGAYAGVSIEVPGGLFSSIKNSFFRFTSNGQGSLGQVNTSGQTVTNGKRVLQQSIGPSTYSISGDGSGQMIFPITAPFPSSTQLLLGDKQILVSANGDFVLGGSVSQGAHDFLFAIRSAAAGATPRNFTGLYFSSGLKIDQSRPSTYSGAINGLGTGKSVWTRRVRLPEGNVDSTAVNDYTLGTDGVGSMMSNRFVIGANNNAFVGAGVSFVDSDNYEIFFGAKARDLSGTGVFLNPAGVLNGASFAPVGNPIAPGQFIGLFGTGMGPTTPVVASSVPFPTTLGGVSVTVQGRPAPLYFVSANQISALVPFATSGTTADIIVRQDNQESNRVTVPVSRMSPGIYSNTQNGIGPGAILKADFSVVTPANATRRGDTVLVYLTGLGALNPALADGAAAPSTSLTRITDSLNVYVGGQRATVSFSGAAPGFAGLYQLNIVIPANAPIGSAVPLAIETASSFHDMVDIAIQP